VPKNVSNGELVDGTKRWKHVSEEEIDSWISHAKNEVNSWIRSGWPPNTADDAISVDSMDETVRKRCTDKNTLIVPFDSDSEVDEEEEEELGAVIPLGGNEDG